MLERAQHAPAGLSPRQRDDYEEWFQFFVTWGSPEGEARRRALRQVEGGGTHPALVEPASTRPAARTVFYPPPPGGGAR